MKKWIDAARLRTLPLSLSGIILGTFLAVYAGSFSWTLFIWACITTLLLQVLSNYANDYGDGIKGTDDSRLGEKRSIASGSISASEMKLAIKVLAILAIASAIGLLAYAYIPEDWEWFILYTLLGFASIWAAIYYTIGDKAYGYRALGDLFVFLFFGLLSVVGTYMLYTKTFNPIILYPAASIGLLSVAVLNLNNMRDLIQDKRAHKKTIPNIIGFLYAKNYHAFLLFTPFILGVLFLMNLEETYIWNYIFLVLLIPAALLMYRVIKIQEYEKLDPELKKLAFLTLFYALLVGIGLILPQYIS